MIVTKRPVSAVSGGDVVEGSHTSLGDDNDGTHVRLLSVENSTYVGSSFTAHVLAGNERCAAVRMRVRSRALDGFSTDSLHNSLNDSGTNVDNLSRSPNTGAATLNGAWVNSQAGGAEWTQARMNALKLFSSTMGVSAYHSDWAVIEHYLDFDIQRKPSVVSVGPTGNNPGNTRTPIATWGYSDPDLGAQYGFQVKVFTEAVATGGGFNPETSANVYDSGVRTGSSQSHTLPSLADGQYRIAVRASKNIRNGHWWSDWVTAATLTISDTPIIPASVTPAHGSTITTSTLTLGGTIGQSALSTPAHLQWEISSSATFSPSFTVTTQSSPDKVSGAVTEQISWFARYAQGTWYIRAKAIDVSGKESGYSAVNTFTISHPPAAAVHSPTGNATLNYGSSGTTVFDWSFTDPDSVGLGDFQTAYQVEISRNDTAAIVHDSGKITTEQSQHSFNIPAIQKDQPLRWRVRLYDQDNVVGSWSPYHLFRVSDVPQVAIVAPPDAGIADSARPIFTWTTTLTGGRTQASHRVRVNLPGAALGSTYDSGVVSGVNGANLNHQPPTNVLQNGVTYEVRVDVTDSSALSNFDVNTFVVQFDAPRPINFTVDVGAYETEGYVEIAWTNATRDSEWVRYAVYRRRAGETEWQLAAEYTDDVASYTFRDQLIPANTNFEWAVTQFATRAGILVESHRPGVNRTPTEGFETGTTGWTLLPGGGSAARITTDGAGGSTASVQLVDSGAGNSGIQSQNADDVPVAPGETVTVRADFKALDGTTVPVIHLVRSDAVTTAFEVTGLPANTWERRSFDFLVPAGVTYLRAEIYAADPVGGGAGQVRVDNISLAGRSTSYAVETEDYWLIDPDAPENSVRLWHVTGDSFTEEFEETFIPIIGRGRKHEIGTRYGYSGSLTAQLFDWPEATAREQRLQLELLRNERKYLYLRNPFGDIWQVAPGAIQITRTGGVGKREFADVSIPYSEVG